MMSNSKNCSGSFRKALRPGLSMSKKIKLFLCAALTCVIFISSCGPSKEEMEYREKSQTIANTIAEHSQGLVTDTISGVTHNFVRTADLKFKVKNVLLSSDQIEELVVKKGGYISFSDLSSHINYNTSMKFKKDSTIESTSYTTMNTVTLKIPNKQLDTVVREISSYALFIDYRKLRADDVKMALYANSLAEKRYEHYQSRLEKKIKKDKENLNHSIKAEEVLLEKQTLADNTSIDSYNLADQVNYSTITLELYQTEQFSREIKAIPPIIDPYSPSFLEQLSTAFLKGVELLKNCFLLIVGIWGLLFFFIVLVFTYKKMKPLLVQKLNSVTK